jgi:hypothetical protein
MIDKIPDDLVNQVQNAVSVAANAGVEVFIQILAKMKEAIDAAIAIGRALAPVVLANAGVLGDLAASGAGEVKEAAQNVIKAGQDFYESPAVQGALVGAWEKVDDAYSMSHSAIAALSGGACCAAFDFMKLEIFRDFYQTVSLFFSNISTEAMKSAKIVWGNLAGLISFDFSFVIPAIPQVYIFGAIGVAAFLTVILFCCFGE